MFTKRQGRRVPRGSLFACFPEVLVLLLLALFVNLAIPDDAVSQISSHSVAAPFSYSTTAHVTQARLPKAPVQVAMPAPPATKIVPGFAEVLVATGPVGVQESADLDAAIKEFHDAPAKVGKDADVLDFSKPFVAFMAAHPQSNWNAAIHLNLGLNYYHSGYFSRTFGEYEQTWKLGRNATAPMAHILIDRDVGELAKMHSRAGHGPELEVLLNDIGNRPVGGPGTELLRSARAALKGFKENPGISYLCGPKALANVLRTLKASRKQIKVAEDAKSGPNGVSLPQLARLASKAGLKYTLIHREKGQPIPFPSIINWNVHHYAAVLRQEDGRYLMADPTFGYDGGGGYLTERVIDAESSGYFLVPAQVMAANPKAGWRTVSAASVEAKAVYGKGNPADNYPGQTVPPLPGPVPKSCPVPDTCPGQGMTTASVTPQTASLHLQDAPVGYKPQIGLPNFVTISYNAREDLQPATFGFSNLSPKWSHSWMTFMQYNVTYPNNGVMRSAGGGGGWDTDVIWVASQGRYNLEPRDNSQYFRNPVSGTVTSFTRNLPDGGKETYAQSNGATSGTGFMFLTSITDAQGNTTTLNYDSSYRLTSVVDAMGRSTTFTYGLTGYPLLVTQVTDPFGRTAQMTYDTSQRLSTITDPLGITSTFTYSPTETTFVNSLATPYGTSTFNDTPNPNDFPYSGTTPLSITLTDPLGYTDYTYYYQAATAHQVTPPSDPSSTIPTGMYAGDASGIYNGLLSGRNTYHWNPHEWATCVTAGGCSMSSGVVQSEDFTKAALTHWYHQALASGTGLANEKSGQVSSVKQPLENRVWLLQEYTGDGIYSGVLDLPTYTGRVLDDGSTQLSVTTYDINTNAYAYFPWPATKTDPLGRETKYTYASNYIDLLTVQQKTSSSAFTTIGTFGSYNTQHEPQTWTGADGQTWNYTYNTVGQLSTVKDPNSNTTTYNYDTTGRLSTIVNANSQTVLTNTYDSADRIQTQTDSQGYTLTYAYDNLDRITSITYPDGTTDQYNYNFQSGPYAGTPSLELRQYTDRLGRVTTYNYDADRRLTSVVEPTQGTSTRTTQYDYYEDGTLEDIIDANGNDTHWAIDLQSRPTSKTYAYGTSSAQTETYTWENTISRLHSVTDALGQVKTFTYAEDNRVTSIAYTSTVNPTPNVSFTWDTYYPRLTSMTDGLGTTDYSYTAVGTNGALKLSGTTGPFGTNGNLGLTYDNIGHLSGRTIAGGNESFGYDNINRLDSHTTPLGTFSIGYLGQTDQITSQSVTNGSTTVSTNWGYDTNTNDRRLISISNSGVTRSYTISYLNGSIQNPYDIQSIADTAASGHPWATQTHTYTNDLIDRLLTETVTTPGNSTFAYDNLDNPTTWNTPASGSLTNTFNGLNQISAWGSSSYSYDADGNLLSGDGIKTYKWDAENRLIEIDYTAGGKSQFSYDGLGHRMVDVETASGGGTTTTRYLWCSIRICQTRDGSDNLLRRDLDEGEYNVSTSQKLLYMPDQLGSVRDVLDGTTGNLVQSYDYTPNGGTARSSGSTSTDYQYGGLFAHAASRLNLSATRAQDGGTGRWLTKDSIGEIGGVNLYSYIGLRQMSLVDPTGLIGEYACINRALPTEDCAPPSAPPMTWGQMGTEVAVDSAIMCFPEVFGDEALARLLADETGGGRVGDYTRSMKNWFKKLNRDKNGGVMKCDRCGKELENVGNTKGQPTPSNQAQVHHQNPISEGGDSNSPHEVLCPACHIAEHNP